MKSNMEKGGRKQRPRIATRNQSAELHAADHVRLAPDRWGDVVNEISNAIRKGQMPPPSFFPGLDEPIWSRRSAAMINPLIDEIRSRLEEICKNLVFETWAEIEAAAEITFSEENGTASTGDLNE